MIKRFGFLAVLAFVITLSSKPALAQGFDICADPGPAGLPAGYTISELSYDTRFGTRWACLVTPPGYGAAPGSYPVLVMLHGGNGNPQNLMQNSKEVLSEGFAANGGQGYVMIFPVGVPEENCDLSDLPCDDNLWGDADVNEPFLERLPADAVALSETDENRVFMAGFSGGAKMIYRMVAAGGPEMPVLGIATMAGGMSTQFDLEDPSGNYEMINIAGGKPVHAMIAQGERDARLPFNGGLMTGSRNWCRPSISRKRCSAC